MQPPCTMCDIYNFVFSEWHSELEVLVASQWHCSVKSLSQRTWETKVKQFLWMSTLLSICYHLTPCQSPSISCLSLTVTGTAPHPSSSQFLFAPLDKKMKWQIFYMVLCVCVWLEASEVLIKHLKPSGNYM